MGPLRERTERPGSFAPGPFCVVLCSACCQCGLRGIRSWDRSFPALPLSYQPLSEPDGIRTRNQGFQERNRNPINPSRLFNVSDHQDKSWDWLDRFPG